MNATQDLYATVRYADPSTDTERRRMLDTDDADRFSRHEQTNQNKAVGDFHLSWDQFMLGHITDDHSSNTAGVNMPSTSGGSVSSSVPVRPKPALSFIEKGTPTACRTTVNHIRAATPKASLAPAHEKRTPPKATEAAIHQTPPTHKVAARGSDSFPKSSSGSASGSGDECSHCCSKCGDRIERMEKKLDTLLDLVMNGKSAASAERMSFGKIVADGKVTLGYGNDGVPIECSEGCWFYMHHCTEVADWINTLLRGVYGSKAMYMRCKPQYTDCEAFSTEFLQVAFSLYQDFLERLEANYREACERDTNDKLSATRLKFLSENKAIMLKQHAARFSDQAETLLRAYRRHHNIDIVRVKRQRQDKSKNPRVAASSKKMFTIPSSVKPKPKRAPKTNPAALQENMGHDVNIPASSPPKPQALKKNCSILEDNTFTPSPFTSSSKMQSEGSTLRRISLAPISPTNSKSLRKRTCYEVEVDNDDSIVDLDLHPC